MEKVPKVTASDFTLQHAKSLGLKGFPDHKKVFHAQANPFWTDFPFQRVATDLFEIPGKHYLLAVDYYKKWPCAVQLQSISSAATANEVDKISADLTVPDIPVSDNGLQFEALS